MAWTPEQLAELQRLRDYHRNTPVTERPVSTDEIEALRELAAGVRQPHKSYECRYLVARGFARSEGVAIGIAYWYITDAGREWLAEHDTVKAAA